MSLGGAYTIAPVIENDWWITKTVNWFEDTKKGKDTMGHKYRIEHGVYVACGGIVPQLAGLTGFTEADAETIKQAIVHMLDNDASSARPYGSMEVCELFWWTDIPEKKCHNVSKILRSVEFVPLDEFPYYEIKRPYILEDIKEEHVVSFY